MFVSVIKFLIVVFALAAFIYCANLAIQGHLEMKVLTSDLSSLYSHVRNFRVGVLLVK